ncbi:MAG: hypothetical protein QY323_03815 [Patescibacteria group bacterium]|nr:MAG: hypothetical protein QY323_03815 [Patescibacteria group bacterium]
MNLHDMKIALFGIDAESELGQFLRYLPRGWPASMPGYGTGQIHFFVRSHRIENGRPVAYDPFWIETCVIDDRGKMDEMKRRTTDKVNGMRWSPPLMPLARPFGPAGEAERAPCACGRAAYVVGSREFPGLGRSSSHAFRQALYALCLVCPKLTLLAERADTALVKLHT